jgi:hypothetical protein
MHCISIGLLEACICGGRILEPYFSSIQLFHNTKNKNNVTLVNIRTSFSRDILYAYQKEDSATCLWVCTPLKPTDVTYMLWDTLQVTFHKHRALPPVQEAGVQCLLCFLWHNHSRFPPTSRSTLPPLPWNRPSILLQFEGLLKLGNL